MKDLSLLLASVILGGALGGAVTWLVDQMRMRQRVRRLLDMFEKVERVTLNEEFMMTALLATKLVSGGWGKPDVIFAVSPGGNMVAEWLSRRFLGNWRKPIPICTLVVKTTRMATGQPSAEAIIERREIAEGCAAWPLADQGKALLVSDISRSGAALAVTFDFLAQHYGADRVAMATLMCQKGTPITPHFCLVKTDHVVRFDWKEQG